MSRSILIIEDEPALRLLLQDYLEFEGFTVQVAPDGATALKLAEGEEFALAFVDINLPDITGDEVMRTLRERGSTTALVVLSGNLKESYEGRIKDLAVYRVLEKPVDLAILSGLANDVLEGLSA